MIRLIQSAAFKKAYKRLHANQREAVDNAVRAVLANPLIGSGKKGDIAMIRVYKFSILKQQTLLAYTYIEDELVIYLLDVGPHENFYRDLKN